MSPSRRYISYLAFFIANLLCSAIRAETVRYYFSDPQGNILVETDGQGVITAVQDYRPYGQIALGPAHDGPGYTGHVTDSDTALVYMQARYYDPSIGRFLSVDPLGPDSANLPSFNRYMYVAGNPIANIDPDGRDILVIAGGHRAGSLSPFGHVASSIQGYGVASFGNGTPLGTSTTQYLTTESTLRSQVVTILPTSTTQDQQASSFVSTKLITSDAGLIDNCAVKTNLILNAAGVSTQDIPFPGGLSRDVSSTPGVKTYLIPKNGPIPQELQNFLKTFDKPSSEPNKDPAPQPPPPPDKSPDQLI
ncbi:RHS repeat-associated core domain-containing protein [Luteibacter rhizovicinus]